MSPSSQRNPLQTILVMVTGFVALGIWLEQPVLLYTALGIGVLGLASGVVAKWIDWGWYKLAEVLGWINGRILLSVVFFLFLVPIAWIYQLTRKNPLQRKNLQKSVFQTRNHLYERSDLEKSW